MEYYWRFNPDKTEERRLLTAMVGFIQDDPHTEDNMDLFKFIVQEWPTLEQQTHTKQGRERAKRRLLDLHVRYIHWNPTTNDWSYWTTYTDEAVMSFYETPKTHMTTVNHDGTPMLTKTRESHGSSCSSKTHTSSRRSMRLEQQDHVSETEYADDVSDTNDKSETSVEYIKTTRAASMIDESDDSSPD